VACGIYKCAVCVCGFFDDALNVLTHYLDISEVDLSPMITIEDNLT